MNLYLLFSLFAVLCLFSGCAQFSDGKTPVTVGDKAPDFELRSGAGNVIKLSDYLGSIVVVFFYPKDNTPICTKEVCAFRDSHEAFQDFGAKVFGISSDSVDSHKEFAQEQRLNFPLLSDEGGKVRALYGVSKTMGLMPGRVTYVIDKKGIVRYVFSSQFSAQKHIDEALKIVGKLSEKNNSTNLKGKQ